MGMLETRTLDFKKLVVTSVNEDVLPKGRSENSLIPFEIRREFGLPTYLDKDAVFAYHFYRLLQRAEDITLIYNGTTEGLNSGEASRFIKQLEFELRARNSLVKIEQLNWNFKITQAPQEVIEKSASVMKDMFNMAERGISPTALIDYVNDQPEFYRKRVLRLSEADEIEEVAGYDTQGNVVHQILEDYYKPVLEDELGEKVLDPEMPCFSLGRKEITSMVEQELIGKSGLRSFDAGKNLIIREILSGMIQRFLKTEKEELKSLQSESKQLQLEGLEKNYSASLKLDSGLEVRIHGNIDRVDRVNGQIRIIDYKTGAVDKGKLGVKDWADLRQPKDGNKSLQLMVYAWLYMKNNPGTTELQAGIISLRNTSKWVMWLKYFSSDVITREVVDEFEKFLKGVVEEIFNPKFSFEKNPVSLQSDD